VAKKKSESQEMSVTGGVKQRSIDTRDRILDAAAAEFADHGFEGASTRNVAVNAGVQHPLLTYHFESKEGLWRAALTSLNERFVQMYRARLEGLSRGGCRYEVTTDPGGLYSLQRRKSGLFTG